MELTGAQFDPKSMLCTVGLKGSVDYTVVNGEIVVKEGRLVRVDEERTVEKANLAVKEYMGAFVMFCTAVGGREAGV